MAFQTFLEFHLAEIANIGDKGKRREALRRLADDPSIAGTPEALLAGERLKGHDQRFAQEPAPPSTSTPPQSRESICTVLQQHGFKTTSTEPYPGRKRKGYSAHAHPNGQVVFHPERSFGLSAVVCQPSYLASEFFLAETPLHENT